ncbi:MAG: beta-propeller fold lactonase family protein [Burkholderiales bacterium]|nr:beta-propeller fold lactonase family protein [Burkholderiales bacterium]
MGSIKKRNLVQSGMLALAVLAAVTFTPATTSILSSTAFAGEPDQALDRLERLLRSARRVGAVYVMTNGVDGNAVVSFRRAPDGSLRRGRAFDTGGRGTGNLLENQGSLVLSQGGEWLFAANPGSDDISVFSVLEGEGLVLVDRVSSGGDRPLSLTVSEDLLYVVNAGGANNITGFTIGADGKLTPLADSTRPLSTSAVEPCPALVRDLGDPTDNLCAAAGPAQIQFSPGGEVLVVTERLTNGTGLIDTYTVGNDGRTNALTTRPPAGGLSPFGFDFAQRNLLVATHNFFDGPGLGAAASYRVAVDGGVSTVTPNLSNGQTASCWLTITNNGRYAYVTNPISATVTSYSIARDGSLSLLQAVTADLSGGDPRDPALTDNGRYLYVLNNTTAVVSAFRVEGDGSLTLLDFKAADGFPSGANGLAAR